MPAAGGQGGGQGGSRPQGNYWLVRTTNQGAGSRAYLENLPFGQKPTEANYGAAVYLGDTVAKANAAIAAACQKLGIPNITHVPSLGTTLGILGALAAGAAAGVAGAGASGEIGAAATTGAGTTEAAGAGAAGGGAASAIKKLASSIASNGKTALAGASLAALFTQKSLWAGIGMVIAGAVLVLLGILGLSGINATPATVAKKAIA